MSQILLFIAARAKVMEIKDKRLFDYNSWQICRREILIASLLHLPVGFGGVLYFPGML